MRRWTAGGMLIGIFLGIVLNFVFPEVLNLEFLFNLAYRNQTNLPSTRVSAGSVFAVGYLAPLILGIIGALFGMVIYKLKPKL